MTQPPGNEALGTGRQAVWSVPAPSGLGLSPLPPGARPGGQPLGHLLSWASVSPFYVELRSSLVLALAARRSAATVTAPAYVTLTGTVTELRRDEPPTSAVAL